MSEKSEKREGKHDDKPPAAKLDGKKRHSSMYKRTADSVEPEPEDGREDGLAEDDSTTVWRWGLKKVPLSEK